MGMVIFLLTTAGEMEMALIIVSNGIEMVLILEVVPMVRHISTDHIKSEDGI